jgi:hypothetical protein
MTDQTRIRRRDLCGALLLDGFARAATGLADSGVRWPIGSRFDLQFEIAESLVGDQILEVHSNGPTDKLGLDRWAPGAVCQNALSPSGSEFGLRYSF